MGKPTNTPTPAVAVTDAEWAVWREAAAHLVVVDHPDGRHSGVGPFPTHEQAGEWAQSAMRRAREQGIVFSGIGVAAVWQGCGQALPGAAVAQADALLAEVADALGTEQPTGPRPVTDSTAHVVIVEWDTGARSIVGVFWGGSEAVAWGEAAASASERGDAPIDYLAVAPVFTAAGVPLDGPTYTDVIETILETF